MNKLDEADIKQLKSFILVDARVMILNGALVKLTSFLALLSVISIDNWRDMEERQCVISFVERMGG